MFPDTRKVVGRSVRSLSTAIDATHKLSWKWGRGEATTLADLGDPTTTADYVLCMYDGVAGTPRLELEKDIPAAAQCKGKPCWRSATSGFRYKDGRLEHGAVKSMTLTAGVDGKAKIKLRANGPTLAPPRLPLAKSPSVRVQLHNLETGSCWEAIYSSATSNDQSQFKARSD